MKTPKFNNLYLTNVFSLLLSLNLKETSEEIIINLINQNSLKIKMKIKRKQDHVFNLIKTTKVGLPSLLICCVFFFLVGLCVHYCPPTYSDNGSLSRSKLMDIVKHNETLAHGVTGDNFISHIPFQVLSWKPKVLYYPNFATAKECQHIINMAKPLLEPSKIALRIGDTAENTQNVRTSSGTFLSAWDDRSGILERIEEKIAKITLIPVINGEDFNVLRYENGQKYDSHYDAFDPSEYGPQKSQRVATFILYLSDVEEGGETMFPFESELNMTYNYNDCIGLKVKPRKGDGILFYSLLMNGTIDPLSIHGSCPVIRGEKWVATKWLRNSTF